MAMTAAAVKAALAALTDEQARKTVGWIAAAVLAPIILIAALLLSLLSGTTQHNNAAVDLVFNGGVVPSSMSAEYAAQVRVMQTCWRNWTVRWRRSTIKWRAEAWTGTGSRRCSSPCASGTST